MVRVDDGQFLIADGDRQTPAFLDSTNGLVVMDPADPTFAMVLPGIHTGVVSVAVEARPDPPVVIDTDWWDEVVEVSMAAPRGELSVQALMADPPHLPVLSAAGAGDYRVRLHARGRDIATDGVASQPVEDYLIIAWPAAPAPEVTHRFSDAIGAERRRSWAKRRPRLEEARATGAWNMPSEDR